MFRGRDEGELLEQIVALVGTLPASFKTGVRASQVRMNVYVKHALFAVYVHASLEERLNGKEPISLLLSLKFPLSHTASHPLDPLSLEHCLILPSIPPLPSRPPVPR